MNVFVSGSKIGDAICAIPVICALAERFDRLQTLWGNLEVADLANFPPNVTVLRRRVDDDADRILADLTFDWTQYRGDYSGHPTSYLFAQAGLPVPPDLPRPRLGVIPLLGIQAYDFVVAPFADDHHGERSFPWGDWATVFYALRSAWPTCSILVVGAKDDPKPWPLDEGPGRDHEAVEYLYGAPLRTVVACMLSARRAVLTVDSGPNRLAWAAGVPNHIILASDVVPQEWASYPGSLCYRSSVRHLNAASVMTFVRAANQARTHRDFPSTVEAVSDQRGLLKQVQW